MRSRAIVALRLGIALGLASSPVPAIADLAFQTRIDYPAAAAPAGVAVVRGLRDGVIDLVVSGDDGLAVLRGTGDGAFALPQQIRRRGHGKAFAAADFDSDGYPDLVYPDNEDGALTFLQGNAEGRFVPTGTPIQSGRRPRLILAAPVNRDDALDLVVAHADGITVLLGDGHGRFKLGGTAAVKYATTMITGDLFATGGLDIVVPDEAGGTIAILRGDGTGQLRLAENLRAGMRPRAVATGDLNGDLFLDFVVLNATGAAVVLAAEAGRYAEPVELASGDSFRALTLADFNRDGHLDVAVADDQSVTVGLLLGNGDGTFRGGGAYCVGRKPVALVADDVNGDNLIDLVVVNYLGDTVTVLLGDGRGELRGSPTLAAGEAPTAVATGDFDADGSLDLAVTSASSNSVVILAGNGQGTFGRRHRYLVGRDPRAVLIADFDADNRLDLATSNFGGDNVAVLAGDGRGTFTEALLVTVGTGPVALANGDFNADRHLDLAVANSLANSVSILFGDGHGRFPTVTTFPLGFRPTFLLTGDLNRDGRMDLIAGDARSDAVSVLHGTDGGIASPVTGNMGSKVQPQVSDDFNRDGLLDLAVAREATDEVAILLGTGANAFSDPIPFAVGHHPTTVTPGDFNNDQWPDLAVINHGSGSISILLNTTTKGTTAVAPAFPPAPRPQPRSLNGPWRDVPFGRQ